MLQESRGSDSADKSGLANEMLFREACLECSKREIWVITKSVLSLVGRIRTGRIWNHKQENVGHIMLIGGLSLRLCFCLAGLAVVCQNSSGSSYVLPA